MDKLKIAGVVIIGGGIIWYLLSSSTANAGRQTSRNGVIFNPGVRVPNENASFGRVSPTIANLWNDPSAVFARVGTTYDVIQDSRNAVEYGTDRVGSTDASTNIGAFGSSTAFGAPPARSRP